MNKRISFLLSLCLIIFSCKKDDKDDKDSTPYDFAQGIWFFESECEGMPTEIPLDDILPESVDIEGEGDGVLSLTILDTVTILGDIDDIGNIARYDTGVDPAHIQDLK